jgi:glycosyltransferase involved in cell wall biosynthesis
MRYSRRAQSQDREPQGRGARPAAPDDPLVSCLMVTRDRLTLAKRAIRCLARQSYPLVELVIVTDGTERFRLALEAASGDVVCQWDDDDCCHAERIAVQLGRMRAEAGQVSFLTDHLQFLEDDRALVWVDWMLGGQPGRDQLAPGTVMMERDSRFRYPETGPFVRRGEDSAFLWSLYDQARVVPVRGQGRLYLYTYHGRTTFDRERHYRLARFSLSAGELSARRELTRAAMAHYPMPRPFVVIGRDGPAYMLND